MSAYTILGTDAKGIETIKGNGWDVDAEHIELNAINAEFNYELDYRYISVKGPAVEDIFKCLRDLIKKNEALTEKNERLTEENYMLRNYCDEQGRTYKTEMDKRDCYIESLKSKTEKRTERIHELEEEIERLNTEKDEKAENYNRLQDAYLKEINKVYTLNKRICELEEEKDEFVYTIGIQGHEIKPLREKLNEEKIDTDVVNYCMNDVMMTQKAYNTTKIYEAMMSSPDDIHERAERIIGDLPDTDTTRMHPLTYSDTAKEVLGWVDGEMKNGTDYATKIFNKEEVENMFSITFCKVPVKSEEDE